MEGVIKVKVGQMEETRRVVGVVDECQGEFLACEAGNDTESLRLAMIDSAEGEGVDIRCCVRCGRDRPSRSSFLCWSRCFVSLSLSGQEIAGEIVRGRNAGS